MAFCKFCGRQLTEGEICSCQNPQSQPFNNINNQQSDNMNNGFNSPSDFNNQYSDGGAVPTEQNKKPKNFIFLTAAAVAFIAVVIIVFALISGSSYKKPFKNIVKGVNKNNIELVLEQFVTDDMMEDIKDEVEDETDEDWKEFCNEAEEAMEEMKEYLEDDFGKNVKFSVKFIDKKDAKKREVKNLEKFYSYIDEDIEIKKAYKIKLELKIKGKDDDEDMKLSLYSVNIKGEGWKIMFDNEILSDLKDGIEDIIDTNIYEDIIDDLF